MKNLLWVAAALVAIWVAAKLLGFFAGLLLNLLLVGALVLGVIWLVRRFTGGRRRV